MGIVALMRGFSEGGFASLKRGLACWLASAVSEGLDLIVDDRSLVVSKTGACRICLLGVVRPDAIIRHIRNQIRRGTLIPPLRPLRPSPEAPPRRMCQVSTESAEGTRRVAFWAVGWLLRPDWGMGGPPTQAGSWGLQAVARDTDSKGGSDGPLSRRTPSHSASSSCGRRARIPRRCASS
jgi:hypothetical protein